MAARDRREGDGAGRQTVILGIAYYSGLEPLWLPYLLTWRRFWPSARLAREQLSQLELARYFNELKC